MGVAEGSRHAPWFTGRGVRVEKLNFFGKVKKARILKGSYQPGTILQPHSRLTYLSIRIYFGLSAGIVVAFKHVVGGP
jgi:hypothetical protein